MAERIIWIVVGETGEYSDHSEWWVRAYPTESEAQAEADRLNAIVVDAGLGWDATMPSYAERGAALTERVKPHDAQAYSDYTGLRYLIGQVPLIEGAA